MNKTVLPKHTLSKSTFIRGAKCLKSLYLYKNHYNLRDEISTSQQALFDQGHEVGNLAKQLLPGGTDCTVEPAYDYFNAVKKTDAANKAGCKVLYEAAFMYNNIYAAVDELIIKIGTQSILITIVIWFFILSALFGCGTKEIEKPDGLNVFSIYYDKVATKVTRCNDTFMYEIAAQKSSKDLVILNWYTNNDTLYINRFGGNDYRGEQIKATITNNGRWSAEWRSGYFKNIVVNEATH